MAQAGNSAGLYDAMAGAYDGLFDAEGHRQVYDEIAWEIVGALVPAAPANIVDAGCGTGRWAAKWIAAGHRVIGVEQSAGMVATLRAKQLGPNFTLIESDMMEAVLPDGCADLVVAMGSVQYTADPAAMIARFARWVRPGGNVCVYMDSYLALALELLRTGRADEAFARLAEPVGVWSVDNREARVQLFDRRRIEAAFAAAGLVEVVSHGLLVTATAWGRDRYAQAIADDPAGFRALERRLSQFPLLADAGKHILVRGQRL